MKYHVAIRHSVMIALMGAILAYAGQSVTAADTLPVRTDCPRIELDATKGVDMLAENTLAVQNRVALFRAMSQLWLGRDEPEANTALIQAFNQLRGDAKTLTPEIADENFKWQMRLWLRTYGLFNSRNGWYPSRLTPEAEAVFHELFWNYAYAKSTVDRADQRFTWFIQGSENHDLMDLSNAMLALEALKHVPQYAKRTLHDGRTIDEHVEAWNAHFCRYADSRVARGLLIECASSIYGKYAIPELVNLADFADNPVLRKKMTMLLDILWADWAVEQIDGIRGGGKSRVYQGKYSRFGDHDSYRKMADVLLGRGDWTRGKQGHTNSGYVHCLATSRYRLPSVVAKLATNRPTQPYASISRRPAKMTGVEKLPDNQPHSCWYVMDPNDTRAVRYTYCTSEYVMGSWWVDPALGESCIVKDGDHRWGNANYAAIHAQNRWQGIIFSGDPNARIYPQCFSTRPDKNDANESVTNHQHIAVQHQNIMLVQANRSRKDIQSMRVYFAPSTRKGLANHHHWLVTTVGDTYAASAAVDSNAEFLDGHWLHKNFFHFDNVHATVFLVTETRARFKTVDQFVDYLKSIDCTAVDNVLTVRFRDADDQPAELAFDTMQKVLPTINGTTINLNPPQVYNCPFMKSDFGSGVVTINVGKEAYVWNMQESSIRPQTASDH